MGIIASRPEALKGPFANEVQLDPVQQIELILTSVYKQCRG